MTIIFFVTMKNKGGLGSRVTLVFCGRSKPVLAFRVSLLSAHGVPQGGALLPSLLDCLRKCSYHHIVRNVSIQYAHFIPYLNSPCSMVNDLMFFFIMLIVLVCVSILHFIFSFVKSNFLYE